jgi:hypothetical protein
MTRLETKDLEEMLKRNPALGIYKAKKQQLQKIERSEKMQKVSKYRNTKTETAGIKFDSKKEAARYQELLLQLQAGEISDLKLQETFVLQRAFTTPTGQRVQAITYTPDFTYTKYHFCLGGEKIDAVIKIVEDVKASAKFQDPVYRNKKKMFLSVYPNYEFIETY